MQRRRYGKYKRIARTRTLSHELLQPSAVNFASVEKQKKRRHDGKIQRVDPPKFTSRMPQTSRCKRDGALISPVFFAFFAVRSSMIFEFRLYIATKRDRRRGSRFRTAIISFDRKISPSMIVNEKSKYIYFWNLYNSVFLDIFLFLTHALIPSESELRKRKRAHALSD